MSATQQLLEALTLEPIEVNMFRGFTPPVDRGTNRIFGGQVIAQALMAAYRTIDDRLCHSLQAYFIRPGDPAAPVLFEVERSRDGKSFATRRVIAIQHGEQILNLAASFQVAEKGLEHAEPMPEADPPEAWASDKERLAELGDAIPAAVKEIVGRDRAIEIRRIDPRNPFRPEKRAPRQQIWIRAAAPIGDDPVMNQVVLAYATDFTLLDTGTFPHGVSWMAGGLQVASLDHVLWFHRPIRMDQWHLYDMDSPSASGGRDFNRGAIYTRDGVLVASVAQEGLIRPRG
jgi:acyl-CoA thioesterase-2